MRTLLSIIALLVTPSAFSQTLTLSTPTNYQVFQRSSVSSGSIYIIGNVSSGTHSIEASFNGGAYNTVAASVSGDFSGTLTGQTAGQGTLTIRLVDTPATTASQTNVGVGDVFLIAGQSNASGRGVNTVAVHPTLKAGMFANDYRWKKLTDPTDENEGQVDAVSDDGSLGSIWPKLMCFILTNQVVPVAIIPSAKGATDIDEWQPGVSHTNRATLYGSAVYRSAYAIPGGVKAVLFWQGESDMDGTSTVTYYSNFTRFASNIFTDLGVKVMNCKLQHATNHTDAGISNINAAIQWAWTSNSAVVATGPDLSDLETSDGAHVTSAGDMAIAAGRWWLSLSNAFYTAPLATLNTTILNLGTLNLISQ